MAEIKSVILDVKLDQGQAVQDASALRDAIAQLNQELKNNKRETEEQKQQYEITKASIKSHTEELNRNTRQLATQQTAVKANNGSFDQLHASLKVGEATLKALTGTIKRNEDGTYELTQEYFNAKKGVDDAKNALLLFNAGIAQGNLNVGNYDNTLQGMRQKLADLQIVIQNTDVNDLNFEKAKNDAAALSTQIQIAEGKIDSMGERIQKNTIRDGFNDAMGAASALTGVLGVMSLAMGNNTEAGETLRKVMIGVTIAQTALTIARQKDDIIGTIGLVRTKAATVAQKLYTLAVGQTTGALRVLRIAIAATGVGLLIIGITQLIQAIGTWTSSTEEQTKSQEELKQEIAATNARLKEQFDLQQRARTKEINDIQNQIELRKAQGASEAELHGLRMKMLDEQIYQQMVLKNTLVDGSAEQVAAEQAIINLQNDKKVAAAEYGKLVKDQATKEVEAQLDMIEKNKAAISDYIADITEKYEGLNVVMTEIRNEDLEDLKQYLINLRAAYEIDRAGNRDARRAESEEDIATAQQTLDQKKIDYQAHLQQMGVLSVEFGEHVGNIFGETLTEAGLDLKKFAGGVTLLILDMLKKTAQAAIAEITAKQIAEKGFIGILTGGLLSGIVTAAFEVAKSQISQQSNYGFYEGGYTGEGNPKEESTKIGRRDYTYHKDEYVVPSKVLNDPQGAELVTKLEKMRIANPLKLNLFGYADGGFAKSFAQSIRNQNTGLSARDLSAIKLFVNVHEINQAQNNVAVTESRGQL